MNDALSRALERGDGLVCSTAVSHSVLTAGIAAGRLVRVLPGVFRGVETQPTLLVRARALGLHDADAVVMGRAAAALTWWPELCASRLSAACLNRRSPWPGFRWSRDTIPETLVLRRGGVAVASPALSAIDLIPELGGEVVDQALRRGVADLPSMWEALRLTPWRPGNSERSRLLTDSRDAPWSEAERHLHRILRRLDLPWAFRANYRVKTGPGLVFLDAALPELRLGFEVDGYEHHFDRGSFEHDRLRVAELGLVDWRVYSLAASTVLNQEERCAVLIERLAYRRAREIGRHGGCRREESPATGTTRRLWGAHAQIA